MNDRINGRMKWKPHGGVPIIFIDHRDQSGSELADQIRQNWRDLVAIGQMKGKDSLLILADITGATIELATMNLLKESAKEVKPYVKASSVVGVSGVKKFLLDVLRTFSGNDVRAFDTVTQAKIWLASQSQE